MSLSAFLFTPSLAHVIYKARRGVRCAAKRRMYLSQFLYRAYRPSSSFIAKWDCHLPFFPLPRMAPTIVGWKQRGGGGGDHAPLAAAGIPSSALPAPRGGLCMRATTSPTFWMVPTTNNTRTGRRTGSAPTSMQIGPSSLPYLLSDLRIHNLRRVRVMMPQTGLRLLGSLRVYWLYRAVRLKVSYPPSPWADQKVFRTQIAKAYHLWRGTNGGESTSSRRLEIVRFNGQH